MLEDEGIRKVHDGLNRVEKLDGIKDKQENYGHVVGEGWRKTKRQKKQRERETERHRRRKGATDVAGPQAIQVITV